MVVSLSQNSDQRMNDRQVSELLSPGQVVLRVGGTVEVFLTLALNTPTYSYACHDAAINGLRRLAALMGQDVTTAVPQPMLAAGGG